MCVPRYTACGGTRHEREGRELRIYLPFAPSDRAAIVSRGRAFCRPQLSLIPCGIRHERVGKSENVILPFAPSDPRSEERRVGNECVSTCSSRLSPMH